MQNGFTEFHGLFTWSVLRSLPATWSPFNQYFYWIFVSFGFPDSFRIVVCYNHTPLLSLSMLPEHNPSKTCSLHNYIQFNLIIPLACVLFLYYHLLRMSELHRCFILEAMRYVLIIITSKHSWLIYRLAGSSHLSKHLYSPTWHPYISTSMMR